MKVNKNKKIKVLVALSGGVDSAVAAALLVKAGYYNVTAAFMINYDEEETKNSTSCWISDYRDAVRVAAKLNIKIIKLNFTKQYRVKVLDYMFKEYKLGRTPNPDVLCNKYIKFGFWLEWALKNGFDYLATGHYARIHTLPASLLLEGGGELERQMSPSNKRGGKGVCLLEAKDKNKDQTYFLHQLNQKQLSHVLFPVGNYTKPEVRKLAEKFALPVANKEESMGICFVGEVPMKEFLQTKIKQKPGNIVLPNGEIIGRHGGLAFYTIGQRHIGLHTPFAPLSFKRGVGGRTRNAADTQPLYVVAKRPKTNELMVGYEDDPLLYSKKIKVSNIHWINPPSSASGGLRRGEGGQTPKFPLKCMVRLRHRQPLQVAVVVPSPSQRRGQGEVSFVVDFATPQRAATPGQFAVFYKNGKCLGGGVIE